MPRVEVVAPRLSANEDSCVVADVRVEPGDRVEQGDLLFVLETTKAASEIVAAATGEISAVEVQVGQSVDVGAVLCIIGENNPSRRSPSDDAAAGLKVTAKARLLAERLGFDVGLVPPHDGRVGVAEVEAFAARTDAPPLIDTGRLTTARAVMIGGGGHAASLIDALQGSGWDIVGALDDAQPVGSVVALGVAVIGDDAMLDELMGQGVRTAFIGVGGATDATIRRKIFRALEQRGFHLPPVVHKSAQVGVDVKLGPATYVLPGAVIGPRCQIGANVIINSGAIVCHDCRIEDHAHITPGAILAGTVRVGEGSVVGMAATVLFGSSIGRDSVIHNSASVVGDVGNHLQLTRTGQRLPNT